MHHPQDVHFYYRGWIPVILTPGDSIQITFDGEQTERNDLISTIRLSENTKPLNSDFYSFLQHDTILDPYYNGYQKLTPQRFLKFHDSIFTLRKDYIKTFLASRSEIDPKLKSWLKWEHTFVPITKVIEFPMYMSMYQGKKADSIQYPDNFFDAVKSLNGITENHYINGNSSTLSNQLYFHYYDKINPEKKSMDGRTIDSLIFVALDKDFQSNPIPIQLALLDKIRSSFNSMNTTYVDEHLDKLKSIYGNSILGDAIFETYEELKSDLANKETPDGVEFIEFTSDNPEDYLKEIISKAEGKIVYIDHWATWCAPCRNEFENTLPEFKSKYKDKIEFVYFCYKSKKSGWKPLIRKYKLSGIHYFVEQNEEDLLSEQMTVDGFPTYTIIDQYGNIVKSDFSYRPSREVTSKIIDSLLQNVQSL